MSAIRKILITGATGKQGGAVLRALLRSGEPISIHALTRNVSSPSALALSEKGVHLVKGSFTDPSSLVQAFQGIDAAFLFTNNTGDKEAEEGIALVDAAKEAGVKFVVFTSVDGAERKSGVPHFDTKFEVEEHIRKVGLAHTILRPVAFMDNFPKKSGMGASMVFGIFDAALRSSGASQKPVQLIAVRDIGWFGAQALLHPEKYGGRTIALAGDELNTIQITQIYGKVENKSVWKAWLPVVILRLLPADAKLMFWWFGSDGYTADIAKLRAEHPGLLTLEAWLKLPEDEQ